MKTAQNIAVVLTALACLAALALSVYPGVLNDLIFPLVLVAGVIVPVVAVAALVAHILARRGRFKGVRISRVRAAVALAMLLGTYALLKFYVPRRVAFAASRSAFESLVAQAPVSTHGKPLGRRLGLYEVDEFAADPRGGVFFRVHAGRDGLGPDQMSYGFAYKPNPQGTPFGAAYYRVFRLGRHWCWFMASDDWS